MYYRWRDKLSNIVIEAIDESLYMQYYLCNSKKVLKIGEMFSSKACQSLKNHVILTIKLEMIYGIGLN